MNDHVDMLATRFVSIQDCITPCLLFLSSGFMGKSGGAGCLTL